jgi:hypothetical protein
MTPQELREAFEIIEKLDRVLMAMQLDVLAQLREVHKLRILREDDV